MQTQTTSIACPNCKAPVTLELTQLLKGTKFSCTQCQSLIGLATDSRAAVKQAIILYNKSIEKIEPQ